MKTIKTSDFQLATFALTQGAEISSIDRKSKKAIFTIQGAPFTLEEDFWKSKPVKIREVFKAERELKRMLFSDSI